MGKHFLLCCHMNQHWQCSQHMALFCFQNIPNCLPFLTLPSPSSSSLLFLLHLSPCLLLLWRSTTKLQKPFAKIPAANTPRCLSWCLVPAILFLTTPLRPQPLMFSSFPNLQARAALLSFFSPGVMPKANYLARLLTAIIAITNSRRIILQLN